MANMIKAKQQNLSTIFSSEYEYHIPAYQRPYSWEVEHAEALFDDLYDACERRDETYFLGSIVLIKDAEPTADVIDGQQRLTTLTILLASLAYNLEGDARRDTMKYIVEEGNVVKKLQRKPHLNITKKDRAFFGDHIHELEFKKLAGLDPKTLDDSQKNIQANAKCFCDKIEEKFADDSDKILDFVSFISLNGYLVVVSTPDEESAMLVFTVMNSRGLPLMPCDLIKVDILKDMSDENHEKYNDVWQKMETDLGREDFNEMFSHIRMIYAKKKSQKKIYEEFKESVKPIENSAVMLIKNIIQPYADALYIIKKEHYESTAHAEEVKDYLNWLNRIPDSDWIPVALLFIKQQRNNPEYMRWFFQKLERLAAYTHICALNVNERINRYSTVIDAIDKEGQGLLDNPASAIELTPEEKKKMRVALDGNVYEMTPPRKQYIMLRLDSFVGDALARYKMKLLTIEHVLPQTVNPDKCPQWAEWWPDEAKRDQWVHRIANLVPLNRKRNSGASNYDFATKKEKYFTGIRNANSFTLTSEVLSKDSWTEADLIERQKELLAVMAEKWGLNP